MKSKSVRTKFEKFGLLVIDKLIAEGHEYITLRQLYAECGAVSFWAKNGVQWARKVAIDRKKIEKIGSLRGVYRVTR
jgi:hypothetical protein